jgi:hypothetical protein
MRYYLKMSNYGDKIYVKYTIVNLTMIEMVLFIVNVKKKTAGGYGWEFIDPIEATRYY